jgi:hypothetical protein
LISLYLPLSQVQWNVWGSIALPLLIWPLIFFQFTFKSADAESSLCQDFKRAVSAYLTILTCGKWSRKIVDLRDVNSDDEMVRDGEGAIRGNSNIGLIIIAFILNTNWYRNRSFYYTSFLPSSFGMNFEDERLRVCTTVCHCDRRVLLSIMCSIYNYKLILMPLKISNIPCTFT